MTKRGAQRARGRRKAARRAERSALTREKLNAAMRRVFGRIELRGPSIRSFLEDAGAVERAVVQHGIPRDEDLRAALVFLEQNPIKAQEV